MIRAGRLALLASAATLAATPASAFSATFSWAGIPACADVSPAFRVSGVPRGTTALGFVMHDDQAPAFEHGGSTVPLRSGGEVPRGAITYSGPCPPQGERHRYVWTLEARDASGTVLGRTSAAGRFPP